MRESELLRRIAELGRGMPARWPRVVVGPGDDCAVVRGADRGASGWADATLLTVDQVVEGRHYLPGTRIDLVARKAVARSISDIAAMGGSPRWALATGVLPEGFAHAAELTEALHRWGESWGAPVVGGDIATGPPGAPLALTVTVGGDPHPQRGPVLRSGARPGDVVWVTGTIGGSLSSGRHLTFEPRVHEGSWLCDALGDRLHAMIDVSDGLGRDAGRIAESSGARLVIEGASVPLSPERAGDLLAAVSDGEDYELLIVTSAEVTLPEKTPGGTRLTAIGHVTAGEGCEVVANGRVIDARALGWDHRG